MLSHCNALPICLQSIFFLALKIVNPLHLEKPHYSFCKCVEITLGGKGLIISNNFPSKLEGLQKEHYRKLFGENHNIKSLTTL